MTKSKLYDQCFIVYEAGSAGLGIAEQPRDAMVSTDGVSREEANSKFWLIDKHGLITESLGGVQDDLKEFVRRVSEWKDLIGDETSRRDTGLLDVVKRVKPTADRVFDTWRSVHEGGRAGDGGGL